jgi:hypothetical protein
MSEDKIEFMAELPATAVKKSGGKESENVKIAKEIMGGKVAKLKEKENDGRLRAIGRWLKKNGHTLEIYRDGKKPDVIYLKATLKEAAGTR